MFKFSSRDLILRFLLLVFSLVFLVNGSLALAEENDFEDLTALSCKVEGTMQGKPAEFWYRIKNIGTEDEAFRLDSTILESGKTMGIIVNEANDSSYYKELSVGSWMPVPLTMIKPYWEEYREEHITAIGGADDWRRWANSDQEEFVVEGEEDGEEYTAKVYDIEVDEPIEDSVFSP